MKKLQLVRLLAGLSAVCLLFAGCAKQPVPESASLPQSAPNQIPLSYTADYTLFEGGDTGIETKFLGLLDQDGKVILPAEYYGISVAENGLIFAQSNTEYLLFDRSGKQIEEAYKDISFDAGIDNPVSVCGFGADPTIAPSAPYIAYQEGPGGEHLYYLLDETGKKTESSPYSDMTFRENNILKCRDGILYTQAADGSVTESGGEVIQTLLGGKFLAKSYHINARFTRLAIETPDGKQVLPAEYFGISEPFKDRLILRKGAPEFLGGSQAFLFDENCKVLASDSNHFSFTVQPDGSYLGISYIGNPYDGYVEAQILDENGNPEPQGAYFIDRDGKRISERYQFIEVYDNMETLRKSDSAILSRFDGTDALPLIEDAAASGQTGPEELFCLCLTLDNKLIKIPARDLLRSQSAA